MKQIIVLMAAVVTLAACGGQDQSKDAAQTPVSKSLSDSLMDQVMNGHDAGMGAMGKIGKADKDMLRVIDSLGKVKTAVPAVLQQAKKDLDSAATHMDQWMDGFDMEMKGMDSVAKINYLRANLSRINSIDDSMNHALQRADSLLQQIH